MPEPIDDSGRLPPGGEKDAGRRRKSEVSRPSHSSKRAQRAERLPIDCDIHDGVPTLHGKARAHYVTGIGGGRMLVFDRAAGERIRINDTTEIVILEVGDNYVKVAVESTDDKELA